MPKRKKVALLACLSSLNPSYSVAGVVRDQLNLLSQHLDLVFITTSDFTDQKLVPENVEIRYYPRYSKDLDSKYHLELYAFEASSILRNLLHDCSHVIQHDLLFIHSFLPINMAIRETAKMLPKIKWIHWQHSAPSTRTTVPYPLSLCYEGMDNSTFVYLNSTDIQRVAESYNIPRNKVQVVFNFIDLPKLFKFHPVSTEIYEQFKLYEADTICIYPTRITTGKQIDKLLKIMATLKEKGQKVKVVICNTWSNAKEEKKMIKELKSLTLLTKDELLFTSEFDSKWAKENNHDISLGLPQEVVSDLLRVGDLFILPSVSECCSMIMLEAAANKNLMVLNDDLWSLHEFGGQKINGPISSKCMYLEFGSLTRPVLSYSPSEEAWYLEKADMIMDYQKSCQPINFFKYVRKYHNPNWVWINQIGPLF